MKQAFTISVNGKQNTVSVAPDTPMLYVLRNNLQLKAAKFGCGLAQCGACMVLLNNSAIPSCQLRINAVGNNKITTLEALAGSDGALHAVQQAFVDEQAAQCGYCTNGMIIAAVSLLKKQPKPSREAVQQAMNVNICRCGTHDRVLNAVLKAANSLP